MENDEKNILELVQTLKQQTNKPEIKQIYEILEKAKKTEEIAKKTNLSKRRIQQIIKKQTGKTPNQIRQEIIHLKQKNLKQTKKISSLKQIRTKKYISESEIENILNKTKNKTNLTIIQTILETGCTLDEITNIKKTDLFDNQLNINGRIITITKQLKKNLNKIQTKSKYIFSSRQSEQISKKRIFQIIKKETNQNAQILRNTCIVNLLQKGISKEKIVKKTGIKNLSLSTYGIGEKINHD
ncbi:hypothetical protein K9L67_01590 [Candidatus Woesearchaeota archaeon]|nr:hypothetical protein [Candidatus Woesearchaeota archaeon]MCF7900896.1 hypothetical protein [Candidatus Woesearchaeota archaeon]